MHLGIGVFIAGFPHQFLGVMRPPFGKGVSDKYLAEFGWRPVGMEKLQKVAGPHFMNGSKKEVAIGRDIFLLLLLAPGGIWWRNIINRGQSLFVRAWNIYIRRVPAHVRQ